MRNSVAAVVLLLVAILGSGVARAQTTTAKKFLLVTVDSVIHQGGGLGIRGLLKGDATPTDLYVSFDVSTHSEEEASACHRAAMLVMLRPGQFVLHIDDWAMGGPMRCTLVKAQP